MATEVRRASRSRTEFGIASPNSGCNIDPGWDSAVMAKQPQCRSAATRCWGCIVMGPEDWRSRHSLLTRAMQVRPGRVKDAGKSSNRVARWPPSGRLLTVHALRFNNGPGASLGHTGAVLRGAPLVLACPPCKKIPDLTSAPQSNGETLGSDTTTVSNVRDHSHRRGIAAPIGEGNGVHSGRSPHRYERFGP
jgi:hypothetical protein